MLITIHWPSIETRAWHSNKEVDIDRVHQILENVYENVIYVMYNNHNHYNAIIPEEISNPKPTRAPIQIKRNLPHKKQLQRYHGQSLNTSALSLSLDLLTATTQCHAEFASSEPDSTPNTPVEGCVESSSLSLLPAQENETTCTPHRKKRKIKRSLSLADSDDSDDDSTQPSAGVFGVESGSDDANSAWHCVVAVRRSNDNESAAEYTCKCTNDSRLKNIQKYLQNENSLIGPCFKTTIPEIKNKIRRRRKHKVANKPQSGTNFIDLSHTPEETKNKNKNKNKKRTRRIIEDTSSDEETKITQIKKKQKRKYKGEQNEAHKPTDITTRIKQSELLSTKDHGWNSTMGRRIHIPSD